MKPWRVTPPPAESSCVSRNNLDLLRLQVGEPLLKRRSSMESRAIVSREPAPAWPDESGGMAVGVRRPNGSGGTKGRICLLQILGTP